MIKKIVFGIILAGIVALGALYWLGTRDDTATTAPPADIASPVADGGQLVERGRYLSLAANCIGCHSVPGGQPFAGGTPLPTPFGTLYGPNITSDHQHGIGGWTADDFWRALHNGKGPGGKLLYPAFPYTEFTHISRADSDALYAYFKTVPAAGTPNRQHDLAFPYNQQISLAMWRAFFFTAGGRQPREAAGEGTSSSTIETDPAQSEPWNRGRYLVDGLAHCAACHAPRDFLGASDLSRGMSGGEIPMQDWYAPPLTNDAVSGLGKWSVEDIAALLKTGVSPHSSASGPMAEVVHHSTQHLTDADTHAIGVYLKSLPDTPPTLQSRPGRVSQATMTRGGKIYEDNCVQCHKADGRGLAPAWPPLAGNPSVLAPTPVNAIHMVLDGGFAPATAGNPRPHGMPPFGQRLNDNDIAAVVSYIRNSWENQAGDVTSLDVKNARRSQ